MLLTIDDTDHINNDNDSDGDDVIDWWGELWR